MAIKKAGKRSSARITKSQKIFLGLLFVAVFATAIIAYITTRSADDAAVNILTDERAQATLDQVEPSTEVLSINFQPLVETWAKSVDGYKSVIIYDLDRNELAASYNAKQNYDMASLYKLFVVYEGYRRLESGEWRQDSPAGATGKTIIECLDSAIRESNSECAESLWQMIGREELESVTKNEFDIKDSIIVDLSSNVSDVAKMMRIYYQHLDVSDTELIDRMKDSFLNQPTTTYDWRQGLPSGFDRAIVYNKVGWEFNPDENRWEIYHDAAIIEFKEPQRHFVVVVMTNNTSFEKIRALGAKIEEYFYANT